MLFVRGRKEHNAPMNRKHLLRAANTLAGLIMLAASIDALSSYYASPTAKILGGLGVLLALIGYPFPIVPLQHVRYERGMGKKCGVRNAECGVNGRN